MAKATIVSFYPQDIDEFVPFLHPPRYHVDASDGKNPQVLVIEDAHYYLENRTGDDRPPIRVPVPADQLAASLVYDFKNSMIEREEGCEPAVFCVPGEFTPDGIVKSFKDQITKELAKQKNWFQRLVRKGDDDWQKFRQHKMISDLHRLAASQLGLGDREWATIVKDITTCPACGVTVATNQVVCQNCRCILNSEAYKKLQFAGV